MSASDPAAYFADHSVLIAGGLGFIGSNLARRLVSGGARVTLVDSLIPEHGGNPFNIAGLEDRMDVHICDVRDAHAMRDLVRGRHHVFSLAGQTSHLDSMTDPLTDLEFNCRGPLSLLEACRRHNPEAKIVLASTRQIYGRVDRLPVDETHALRPVDVNGIHKLASEWYHMLYQRVHGLRTCALRLTNTYGPRMRVKDGRQTFLGVWIRQLIEGKTFEVWGGGQLRDLTHVDDVVDALLRAAASDRIDGQALNLGGSRVVSLRELADLLIALNGDGAYTLLGFPPERERIDIGDYYADFGRIRAALGWEPRVALEAGLAETLAFYRQHLGRYV